MTNLRFTLFTKIIIFLDRAYLKVGLDHRMVHEWVGTVSKRIDTRGPVDAIAWVKALRLCCTRYLAGQPLDTVPGFGGKLQDGLPLEPVCELFRSRVPAQV